jgi:hypothetical protein
VVCVVDIVALSQVLLRVLRFSPVSIISIIPPGLRTWISSGGWTAAQQGRMFSRLGGVVVGVLSTGRKGRGFDRDQGDGFLRAIKSAAHLLSDGK